MPQTELAREQKYFDQAADAREARRARIRGQGSMVANTWTDGGAVGTQIRRELDALGPPDSPVAIARFDLQGSSWYVGLAYISDRSGDPLVVSWQSPLVKSYYEQEELLNLKRVFNATGNTLVSYIDSVRRPAAGDRTAGPTDAAAVAAQPLVPAEGEHVVPAGADEMDRGRDRSGDGSPSGQRTAQLDAAILAEMERERTGQLGQVVATIQKEQYAVLRAAFDGALVVQGGPGTGKTIVGLHRASYLLFNERDRMRHRRLLVVGPNARFMNYVLGVLPSLGDADVTQASANSLGPTSSEASEADRSVARVKGDPRMAAVLARAVTLHVRDPEARIVVQTSQGRVTIDSERLADFIAGHRSHQAHNEVRRLLRAELSALTATALRSTPASLGADRGLEKALNQLWPRLSAHGVLDGLLRRRDRLRLAAEGILSVEEQDLLVANAKDRPRGRWTASDIPLLDELEAALNGSPAGFEHVVVDEAQDLTPMQLRCVRRRCTTGSFTILGDLAQATGVWEHADWPDLVSHLRPPQFVVAELRHSYRVPAPVLAASARLMQHIAPGLSPPLPTRRGPAPRVVRTSLKRLPARAATIVAEMVNGPGTLCVVCCEADVEEVSQAVNAHKGVGSAATACDSNKVNVLAASQVKGQEFDHTIVIEPEAIMEENDQGSRLLYVAMTRPTKSLTVLYSHSLPALLDLPAPADGDDDWSAQHLEHDSQVDALIQDLLSQITTALPKDGLRELADRVLALANEGVEWLGPRG